MSSCEYLHVAALCHSECDLMWTAGNRLKQNALLQASSHVYVLHNSLLVLHSMWDPIESRCQINAERF